jgi:plasmid replication initiation protein
MDMLLRKHRAIIQSFNIDSVARKTYNILLSNSFSTKNKGWHTISFAEIKKKAGLGDTSNINIKKQILKIMKNPIELNILNGGWHALCLISEAKLENGILKYKLPDTILEALFNPDNYAVLDLAIIKGLKSKYAIALYELAIDYLKREIPKMNIENFRKLMGVEQEKYRQSFTVFENKVIKPAVREINGNEKINFKIRYETYKTGRKITHIKFFVEKKEDEKTNDIYKFIELLRECFNGMHFFAGIIDNKKYELAINSKGYLYDPENMKLFSKQKAIYIYEKLYKKYLEDEKMFNSLNNCKRYIEEENELLSNLINILINYHGETYKILKAFGINDEHIGIEAENLNTKITKTLTITKNIALSLIKNERLNKASQNISREISQNSN